MFSGGSFVSWMALALYAETLEIGSCFRFGELLARLASVGRGYGAVVALWVVGFSVLVGLGGFIPLTFLGLALTSFLGFPLFLVCLHALAQVVGERFQPDLRDPLDWVPEAPPSGAPAPRPEAKARKASSFVDRPSETVLTWSTDSDEPLP